MPKPIPQASIVFTDLDGTLLDPITYRWEEARPALELLRRKGIPLIFCSSKTRSEALSLRKAIACTDPFITENGGGIFIPKGYFKTSLPQNSVKDSYHVIELGLPYSTLRKFLLKLSTEMGVDIQGYGDWTVHEISLHSGLSDEESALAKCREYDEPFIIKASEGTVQKVLDRIVDCGFKWARGGRFYHLTGKHDKGSAVKLLSEIYRRQEESLLSIGLGDSFNDLSMLKAVDQGFLLPKPDGSFIKVDNSNHIKVNGIGPVGWNRTILSVFSL